jgi:exo-1,4-beta-D-glucosaminidase
MGLLSKIWAAIFGIHSVYLIGEKPGITTDLGHWRMQSSLALSDVAVWTVPGLDDSNWYHIDTRATVMAGLLENGVFDETTLFYSNNMESKIGDTAKFEAPWLYRFEFWLKNKISKDEHYFLRTHGVTSKADIYVNGALVAPSSIQQGSYGGHTYDITRYLRVGNSNALLIQAYPTNYLRDFAQGFVDWNPYPADNGTGLWRDVTITKTGPVSISSPRVLTNFRNPDGKPVMVNVIVDVTNHENKTIKGTLKGSIQSDTESFALSEKFSIRPLETKTIPMKVQIKNPKVWWPRQWGSQPLYTVNVNAAVGKGKGKVSDVAEPRRFGIRQVDSYLNSHNDTAFKVNGSPFLVLGGGYTPDIFLRFDVNRVRKIFQYMLDMGLNTVRLEGKQEHPQLYDLADEMGLMVMAGWECCDKWEGWEVCHVSCTVDAEY